MVQMKKINAEAFGDILAGLETTVPDLSSPSPARIDASWVESLQTAASLRKSTRESSERSIAPERASDPAEPLRRNLGSMAWGWRSGISAQASPSGDDYAEDVLGLAEQAIANEAQDPAESLDPQPVHGLRRLFSQIPWRWWRGEGRLATADEEPDAAPKLLAPRTEDEQIAEELGLRADLAIGDLKRIRRDFAKKNHPDRFEPAQRVAAARRMSVANMLIDQRLKRKRSGN
ncbi:MAG: hypothetical protein WDN46_03490 [Methylocella sp.]